MSTPTDRNRLSTEGSPYLRQHADNPVNWQPWDDRAFETAAEHDVPLFVSVGYAACHWCHVMEEESFSDPAVAETLNESFVPIKVDREERPDVDDVLMTVCQLVSGGGGWPLSAWCTPDGKPFYIGTYFPREPTRGRPGFLELCDRIGDSWSDPEQRAEMESRADQWMAAARDEVESVPDQPGDPPGSTVLEDAAAAAVRGYDEEHGGFGTSGPKFPQPRRLDLLLRAGGSADRTADGTTDRSADGTTDRTDVDREAATDRNAALQAATGTLDAMGAGGLYDHVGGGFHRYATDRSWTVPHFEKMLYDNAELPRVLLDAFQATGTPRYGLLAQETFAFLDRELSHPDGGFFSTLDARSVPPASRRGSTTDASEAAPDPVEGAFYTWTPTEIDAVLEEPDASLVRDRFGVTPAGNFERGTTVLTESTSIEELATDHGLDRSTVRDRLRAARLDLYEARERRPRPARDEKVIAGWNGRAISAFAAGARALDPGLSERATAALEFVRDRLWDATDRRLDRRWIDGDRTGPGYLDDYAFLARGAFDTYQVTGRPDQLGFAIELADRIVADFYDEEAGTIYSVPSKPADEPTDGAARPSDLSVRPQSLTDRSLPSSVGVAVELLAELDGFVRDRPYRSVAETVLETHADRIRAGPLEHASLVLAADRVANGGIELVFAADDRPESWRETLSKWFLPGAVVAPRPATSAATTDWCREIGVEGVPPIWDGRDAIDGEPTVYACRGFACSPPETDIEAALDWL
ncbi:thioredoxin domain-containing protein [Halopenitus sp. POP-27]|uniref:thioredoxin domain-containing protein n=1 Tax=Halopenitus sp. POP-27 TaxID=2994425 RepID=UPI0024685CC2|nr:thioredoxin domain-containing protein [Halopenitus sp. POP-27]